MIASVTYCGKDAGIALTRNSSSHQIEHMQPTNQQQPSRQVHLLPLKVILMSLSLVLDSFIGLLLLSGGGAEEVVALRRRRNDMVRGRWRSPKREKRSQLSGCSFKRCLMRPGRSSMASGLIHGSSCLGRIQFQRV